MENTTPDPSKTTPTTTGAKTPEKKPYLLVTNYLQLAALYPAGNPLRVLPLGVSEAIALMDNHEIGAYVTDEQALAILEKVTQREIPIAKESDIPLEPRILLGEINVTAPTSNLILPDGKSASKLVVYFFLVDPVIVTKPKGPTIGSKSIVEVVKADGSKESSRSDGSAV